MTGLVRVVREDGNGTVLAGFPEMPLPNDVIRLASPEQNLDGRFRVLRREFTGGLSKTVLVVVPATSADPLTT